MIGCFERYKTVFIFELLVFDFGEDCDVDVRVRVDDDCSFCWRDVKRDGGDVWLGFGVAGSVILHWIVYTRL